MKKFGDVWRVLSEMLWRQPLKKFWKSVVVHAINQALEYVAECAVIDKAWLSTKRGC